MAEYFGVRHFSPACAYYVTEFLDRVKPDVVLIEGPSDLDELIRPLCGIDSHLPAAILAYTEEAPVKTVMWPFAEFSPEYRTMLWAVEKGVPVRFCDLPSSCFLAQKDKDKEDISDDKPRDISVYERMAQVTGQDNDTFWEYTFEQCRDHDDFLRAAEEYGRSLREFSENDDILREAYMRRRIAEARNEYGDNIAVITGAFHTYGLKDVPFSDDDKKLTDKLSSVKCRATLMPYSYFRLSSRSGYGAGSRAPGYYELLWKNRLKGSLDDTAAEYLSKIAAYQRENGYAASSAEVIEALRLADTLASMRGGRMPALSDLRDAAVTCLGHGSFGEISLACADTEIGVKIGSLPEGTVCTSVQEDFIRQLKELKLERYRKAAGEELELDLRENLRVKTEKSAFLDLNRSFFLHRLRMCGVHFAETRSRSQDNATWAELWKLQWSPETEIEIVEASLNGDTVEEAAAFALNSRLLEAEKLSDTAAALSDAFLCGLPDCVKTAASAVQGQAADCTSLPDIGQTIGTLSETVRFGSIRRLDPEPVKPLMQQLFLRFCLGISIASVCDKNAAEELVTAVSAVNNACLSHDFLDEERFITAVSDLADSDTANSLISGFACAVLMERGMISSEKLSELIGRRLSKGTPPADGALWFEGLSRKNRRSLISRLSVWEKLCGFIAELDEEEFKPVLVCLRRTFSEFSPGERSDIAENIGEVLGISKEEAAEFVTAEMSEEEKQAIDELDDFDFGDI
ncbi:MAG: DUF5682 family protein [Oscillospiraceae bacterium]